MTEFTDPKMSVAFDVRLKRYYDPLTNHVLRGLHGVLAQKFYPADSTFANIKYRKPTKSGRKLMKGIKKRKCTRSATTAKRRGIKADEQIKLLVDMARGDPLVLRSWVDPGKKLVKFVKKDIPKRPLKRIMAETGAAIRTLQDAGWTPIACQVPVGSVQHGIATSVDIECRNKAGKIGVCEHKTGYVTSWDAGTGQKLNAPLEKLDDTCRHKAHLQVTCTALLYKEAKGVFPEPFVLRTIGKNGQIEKLLPEMQKAVNAIGKQLVS